MFNLGKQICESKITCPECEFSQLEKMPSDSCQYFYECKNCHKLLKPKEGDCCVFCSYGSCPCPPIQNDKKKLEFGKSKHWGILILFVSFPTLLCCALPILLVSLGMGAAVASIYGEYLPFLRWFGFNEEITFSVTGIILLIAGWAIYRSGKSCPSDPYLAKQCTSANKWNKRLYWLSVLVWLIGFFAAYIMPIIYKYNL